MSTVDVLINGLVGVSDTTDKIDIAYDELYALLVEIDPWDRNYNVSVGEKKFEGFLKSANGYVVSTKLPSQAWSSSHMGKTGPFGWLNEGSETNILSNFFTEEEKVLLRKEVSKPLAWRLNTIRDILFENTEPRRLSVSIDQALDLPHVLLIGFTQIWYDYETRYREGRRVLNDKAEKNLPYRALTGFARETKIDTSIRVEKEVLSLYAKFCYLAFSPVDLGLLVMRKKIIVFSDATQTYEWLTFSSLVINFVRTLNRILGTKDIQNELGSRWIEETVKENGKNPLLLAKDEKAFLFGDSVSFVYRNVISVFRKRWSSGSAVSARDANITLAVLFGDTDVYYLENYEQQLVIRNRHTDLESLYASVAVLISEKKNEHISKLDFRIRRRESERQFHVNPTLTGHDVYDKDITTDIDVINLLPYDTLYMVEDPTDTDWIKMDLVGTSSITVNTGTSIEKSDLSSAFGVGPDESVEPIRIGYVIDIFEKVGQQDVSKKLESDRVKLSMLLWFSESTKGEQNNDKNNLKSLVIQNTFRSLGDEQKKILDAIKLTRCDAKTIYLEANNGEPFAESCLASLFRIAGTKRHQPGSCIDINFDFQTILVAKEQLSDERIVSSDETNEPLEITYEEDDDNLEMTRTRKIANYIYETVGRYNQWTEKSGAGFATKILIDATLQIFLLLNPQIGVAGELYKSYKHSNVVMTVWRVSSRVVNNTGVPSKTMVLANRVMQRLSNITTFRSNR